MSDIIKFEHDEFGKVRSMLINGEPHFVGVDVARALKYKSPSDAVTYHCKGILKINIPSKSGNQETRIISEPDLYRLIFGSKLKSAKKFQDWVYDEVLPSIRKTGKYEVQKQLPSYLIDDEVLRAQKWIEERTEKIKIEGTLKKTKPYIALLRRLTENTDNMLVRVAAKVLSDSSNPVGEKELYKKLRQWKLVLKNSTEPSQTAIDKDYLNLKPYANWGKDIRTTQVTPKGLVYIGMKLMKEQYNEDELNNIIESIENGTFDISKYEEDN